MGELIPLGIHFGLDEATYHSDPALGSTSLKSIHLDAIDFQFDRLYAEDKDTPAKLWGSAFHARTLEGRQTFNAKYRIEPSKDQFKDLLVTANDLKGWLAERGISTRGVRQKADMIKLVREADATVLIWDVIMARFQDELEGGVTALPVNMAREIELAVTWMQRHEKLKGVMSDGAFFGGAAEVSVFYEYDGVRLKARFDYLYPTLAVDLKSYRPWRPRETRVNVLKAIRDFRYDLQSAAYRRAFAEARRQYHEGQLAIYGEPPTDNFVDLLFHSEQIKWLWCMVKATSAPTSTLVEFPDMLSVFRAADAEIETAIHTYKTMCGRFGADADWMPEPDVLILSDEDFPPGFGIYA